MNLAFGKILIDSYRRAKTEETATKTRLKNARAVVSFEDLQDLEKILGDSYDPVVECLEEEIDTLCNKIPVYRDFLSTIDGLDQIDALELLVYIKDIRRFENISRLWSYSGLAPVYYCRSCNKRYFDNHLDGGFWAKNHLVDRRKIAWDYYCRCENPEPYLAANRKRKDMTPDYNEKMKKIAIIIGDKLSKGNDFYHDKFVNFRKRELMKDLTSIHADNRARRKVSKLFLRDLFNKWREIEGLMEVRGYRGN